MHQTGPSANLSEFEEASRSTGVAVPLAQLEEWTPSPANDTSSEPSWEIPLLPSQASVRLFARVRRGPRFDRGYSGVWQAFEVQGDINETTDKRLFRHSTGPPVWKGRAFNQYDPHGNDPAGHALPTELEEHLQRKRQSPRSQFRRHFLPTVLRDKRTLPLHNYRIAFRDVTNRTNSRTIIACLVPPETGLANSAPYLVFPTGGGTIQAFVLGVLNSLPFDWQARRFVETHASFFILNMLSFPPAADTPVQRIGKLAARLSCVDERFAGFAAEVGVEYGPFREDPANLRAEIDALVARAYGLDEADLLTVFSDFTEAAVPSAYREKVLGEFREMR